MKFTKKGGTITIGAEDCDYNNQKIKISVKDTGAGIKNEDLGKLFKAFGKINDTRKMNT